MDAKKVHPPTVLFAIVFRLISQLLLVIYEIRGFYSSVNEN